MKDWLGNTLTVGDKVLYPAGSGRSITMVLGEIVGFGERTEPTYRGPDEVTTIKVRPILSSRWQQHRGTDYCVDSRTGKRIDPFRAAADGTFPHITEHGHYRDSNGTRHKHQRYCGNAPLYEYVSTVFAAHVEKRHDGPKPVTLHVTENVTRWDGEIKAEEPDPQDAQTARTAGGTA